MFFAKFFIKGEVEFDEFKTNNEEKFLIKIFFVNIFFI